MRFGDYAAKLGAIPASKAQLAIAEWRLGPHGDEDGFRHVAAAVFHDNEVVYDLNAQLWADSERQPIEDASINWPVAASPYRTVATLRLLRQDAYSPKRVRYFD
ncbi:hypothetical protein LOK46_21835 [Methylobacterium sp. NMS14P]|uniref:hypothetical protein n=1 Tax=Methylobacterium sp. NMS14P TaxID=2894310 RepID=UPI0023595235|nr:hypothetical protein [Methylobacterium sp. NMS14P]WCS23779.1 hypothetical protein LOK46_21835 [Methylobacterium sp. NMS14P]